MSKDQDRPAGYDTREERPAINAATRKPDGKPDDGRAAAGYDTRLVTPRHAAIEGRERNA